MAPRTGWLTLAFLLAGCASCEEDPPAAAPERHALAEPIEIAAGGGFDLVSTADGAVLVFARPSGGLGALRLDAEGCARGAPIEIDASDVLVREVVAARGERTLAVAWVRDPESADASPEAYVARSLDGGARWATIEPLGPTVAVSRGRLAISAAAQRLVVHHRVPAAPCRLTSGPCAHVARHTVGAGPSTIAERDFLREEVDHPCDPLVIDAIQHLGSSFHALCHDGGAMVFVIDEEPALATPVSLPEASLPLGLVPLDAGVALLYRHRENGALQAAILNAQGDVLDTLSNVIRHAHCVDGRPVMTLSAESAAGYPRVLAESADRLGLLVESAPGARAAWTGEALLVAELDGGHVQFARLECQDDQQFARSP